VVVCLEQGADRLHRPYGPADATVSPKPHHLVRYLNPDWFLLSGTGLPRLSRKRGRQTGVVVVGVVLVVLGTLPKISVGSLRNDCACCLFAA